MKKSKRFLAGLLLAGMTLNTAQAFEYTGADIEIDAVDYSGISDPNRWFAVGDGSLYTAWANHWLEFDAYLDVGEWNIGINVQNRGYLGEGWYNAFQVHNNFTHEVLTINASQTEIHNGYFTADIDVAANYTVRYTWLNDQWDPHNSPVRDANIQINNAFFDKMTAVPTPGSLALMALAGSALFIRRRRSGRG